MTTVEVEGKKRGERKRGLGIALENAWRTLSLRDPEDTARNSGSHYDKESCTFMVEFLGEDYFVKTREKLVTSSKGEGTSPFYALLILHYLTGSKGIPLRGELISFRELYGGNLYYQAFKNRAIEIIRKEFKSKPEKLLEKGMELGGKPDRLGDFSVSIPVFPKVPVKIVLWLGDEEVPSSVNILFDSTVGEHLHTEDIAAISEELARRLCD
ncbi:MAG: DUF3786 domain-containing protein [Thermoplasmata archaeon]